MGTTDRPSATGKDALPGEPNTVGSQPPTRRSRAGFAWGLLAGVLVAVLIAAAGTAAVQIATDGRYFASTRPQSKFILLPTRAGTDWFSVSPSGKGTLRGWASGAVGGGGGESWEPSGAIGAFEVGVVGTLDSIKIEHTVNVYFTRNTKVLVGGKPFRNGPVDAIIDEQQEPDRLLNRLLTIDFHRVGIHIVADRISAPLKMAPRPL